MDEYKKISIKDTEYPKGLMDLDDPPGELYKIGTIPGADMVAIVGTRNADVSAAQMAGKLAFDLSNAGIVILSGGALGIDTAAHQGALEALGTTVSVIGSGFDFMYPEENEKLFKKISEKGALISEYHPKQPPTKWTFPRRNRLVAAMAQAVIVVQAGLRSGALITAGYADELGVPVGAVPGTPQDVRNRGCNALLRKKAAIIESAKDVIKLLGKKRVKRQLTLPHENFGRQQKDCKSSQDEKYTPKIPDGISDLEKNILKFLDMSPAHIDTISQTMGMSPGETGAALVSLEIIGLVQDSGGKNYHLVK